MEEREILIMHIPNIDTCCEVRNIDIPGVDQSQAYSKLHAQEINVGADCPLLKTAKEIKFERLKCRI